MYNKNIFELTYCLIYKSNKKRTHTHARAFTHTYVCLFFYVIYISNYSSIYDSDR